MQISDKILEELNKPLPTPFPGYLNIRNFELISFVKTAKSHLNFLINFQNKYRS